MKSLKQKLQIKAQKSLYKEIVMSKFQKFFFLILLLITPIIPSYSVPINGWEVYNDYSILYMNQKGVFDTRDTLKTLPASVAPEQYYHFILFVSEYYTLKGDKDGFNNLLRLAKTDKVPDNEFLSVLMQVMWKAEKKEVNDAVKLLEDFIKNDESSVNANIANAFRSILKNTSISSESHEFFKNLSCNRAKPYYSFCRVIKLRAQLDYLTELSDYYHRDYLNMDRVLAPFFEESELSYIYFLDKIIPDFPSNLAYLGFANEAVHFQKMLILQYKLTSQFDPVHYERLSYYQMLSDDQTSAEETLNLLLKKTTSQSFYKNNIYLKLGTIAFLRKDYRQSLAYYLDLNLKNWGKSIKHPYYDDSITTNSARDLISLSIWKSKSAVSAVKALNTLNDSSKVNEENLFIRLRIAHILMAERPEVAEKISEDIVYLAQSKGWKRIEYSATLLQGYCNILTKKYRKATVQFTKSYGILGGSDPAFTSEWVRQSGMLAARLAGGERGNHIKSVQSLLGYLKREEPSDDNLLIRNYVDSRFDIESFLKTSINYSINYKHYITLLDLLYYHQKQKIRPLGLNSKGIFQIPEVNRRLKIYKGMRPSLDSAFYKGIYSKLRESEASKITADSESFDEAVFKEISDPFIAAFSFQEKIIIIAHNPDKREASKWNIISVSATDFKTQGYYSKIYSGIPFLSKASNIQILLNPIGYDMYNYLKRTSITANLRFFYGFSRQADKKPGFDLQAYGISSDPNQENSASGIQYVAPEFFEGMKTFSTEDRLHIWNVNELSKKDPSITFDNYEWKCSSQSNISFPRLYRRIDLRMVPYSMLITNSLFYSSTLESPSQDYYSWADFWMKKGVNTMFYTDKLESDKSNYTEFINVLSKTIPNSEEATKMHSSIKLFDKEVIILTKNLR